MNVYNSGSTRALVVYAVFGILAFVCLASIVSGAGEIGLMQKIDDGRYVSEATAEANDDRVALVAGLYIFVYIVSAIVFLTWIYRANSNLSSLRAQENIYTPGWAVGWFFVPFMNLVRPYQVVSEIWKGSNPAAVERVPGLYVDSRSSPLIGVWWGLHLLGSAIGWIASTLYDSAEEASEVISANYAYIFSDVMDIAGIVVVILMVRSIDQQQLKRHEIIESLPVPAIPDIAATEQSQKSVCSDCNGEIPDGSKFCPVCGSSIIGQNAQAEQQSTSEETIEGVIECNLCGKDVKASSSSCPYCGAGL